MPNAAIRSRTLAAAGITPLRSTLFRIPRDQDAEPLAAALVKLATLLVFGVADDAVTYALGALVVRASSTSPVTASLGVQLQTARVRRLTPS